VASVLVFDVNETLLDLGALREPFTDAFEDAEALAEWFVRTLHGSLVATTTSSYVDFASIAGRALDIVAARRGRELGSERETIIDTMARLPPHPEVPEALERLRTAGFPIAALTNSPPEMARAQLEHANIRSSFDEILSVHEVRRYKPAPEPYRLAAERFGVPTADLRMVASHDWDVWGAMRAGCAAAYVARADRSFLIGSPPDIVEPDLGRVADEILRLDRPKP
jgi:2-haloacid dehalogenase